MAIGLSNEGKWVFNTTSTMPRCYRVVHFEVKVRLFWAVFRGDRADCGGISANLAVFLQR